MALGGGSDWATVYLTNGADHLVFTAGGIDVGLDLDQDITLAGTEQGGHRGSGRRRYHRRVGLRGPVWFAVLHRRPARRERQRPPDRRREQHVLIGDAGNDTLRGRGGHDWMQEARATTACTAPAARIGVAEGATIDGADLFDGGSDRGLPRHVQYWYRTNGIVASLGDGVANDGEPGEGDQIEGVEQVIGGSGDDVVVGTDQAERLYGGLGDDELWGGGGNDRLYGEGGADSLFGEDGDDQLEGGPDNDVLTGGAGIDWLWSQAGDDILYNADGEADDVACGTGTMDDAEPDPLDTFYSCEL